MNENFLAVSPLTPPPKRGDPDIKRGVNGVLSIRKLIHLPPATCELYIEIKRVETLGSEKLQNTGYLSA